MKPQEVKNLCEKIFGEIPCHIRWKDFEIEVELSDFSHRRQLHYMFILEEAEMLEYGLREMLARFIETVQVPVKRPY